MIPPRSDAAARSLHPAMSVAIEQVDTRVAPDALLEEMWHYYHELYREALPDDPPQALARTVADWRALPEDEEAPRWLLREDGEIRAVAVGYVDLVDNLDQGFARVHVTAPRRGSGLARTLAEPLFDWLQGNGRSKLLTAVNEGGKFDPFLTRLGLKEAYHDQRSRLRLARIDSDLMRNWIDRAAERATDYELVHMHPPFSDDAVERYCEILLQMNTAPREDLDEEDFTMTPERWRERERVTVAGEYALHTVVAVHRPTGEYAASTSIAADLLDPIQAWQWETVVHPEHRNLGLGRWIKAAMVEEFVSEHPETQKIDTENSVTNKAMLAINLAMGFTPILREVYWQGDLGAVRSAWGI